MERKDALYQNIAQKLFNRGVELEDIASIVYNGQKDMIDNLKFRDCLFAVKGVIAKREVQHIIYTGIALDVAAEKHQLIEPIQKIIYNDEGLYGCDEDLATKLCNLFGSISETNYGYLDVKKHGIIKKLDEDNDHVNTFLDDLVGAIAASAMAWLAHHFDNGYTNRVLR